MLSGLEDLGKAVTFLIDALLIFLCNGGVLEGVLTSFEVVQTNDLDQIDVFA